MPIDKTTLRCYRISINGLHSYTIHSHHTKTALVSLLTNLYGKQDPCNKFSYPKTWDFYRCGRMDPMRLSTHTNKKCRSVKGWQIIRKQVKFCGWSNFWQPIFRSCCAIDSVWVEQLPPSPERRTFKLPTHFKKPVCPIPIIWRRENGDVVCSELSPWDFPINFPAPQSPPPTGETEQ